MAAWVNPDRGELFFARKVVLVEGETEHAIFPFLASRLGCFDPSVTIVDCGSKHNLLLYIRILNAYGITYVVVHDEDPLPDPIPDEWDDDKKREKRRTFELNTKIAEGICEDLGSVFVLSPDFERASGVSRKQGDKMGKAIAALEHFSPLPVENIPETIQEIVRALYCKD
jgi:CRISPR-associated exonuclease Cas4